MNNGLPTAAPARFPYYEHRTMAEVMHDEFVRRPKPEKHLTRAQWEAKREAVEA